MNKLIQANLIILFILAMGYQSFGQRRGAMPVRRMQIERLVSPSQRMQQRTMQTPNRNPVQVVKENFISTRLRLSGEQSKSFWPLYRQYTQELREVRQKIRINTSAASPDGAEQVRKNLEYEAQLVSIKQHYNEEFLKVLPPEKVSELYKSEREFNDEVIKQATSEHGERAGN